MANEKIALLVDSGTDVPISVLKRDHIFMAPLNIHYADAVYQDSININPEDVYKQMPDIIPTTSTPSGEQILSILEKIAAEGFQKVVVITISSGLSGTLNAIRVQANQLEDLEFAYIDTKNISVASGLSVIFASNLIESKEDFNSVVAKTMSQLEHNKIFFYVDTLMYLIKGGRIGRVSGMVGQLLNIKPVISCDESGIYYPVAKERGKVKALKKLNQLVEDFSESHEVDIIIVNAQAKELAQKIQESLMASDLKIRQILSSEVSPALGVHTGPGAIGVAVHLVK